MHSTSVILWSFNESVSWSRLLLINASGLGFLASIKGQALVDAASAYRLFIHGRSLPAICCSVAFLTPKSCRIMHGFVDGEPVRGS